MKRRARIREKTNADRVTVAVTLYALLELYKQGEASWIQDEPFAEITVTTADADAADAADANADRPRLSAVPDREAI